MVPGQLAGQGYGISGHHYVQVRLALQAPQQTIAHGAAHQGCARR